MVSVRVRAGVTSRIRGTRVKNRVIIVLTGVRPNFGVVPNVERIASSVEVLRISAVCTKVFAIIINYKTN